MVIYFFGTLDLEYEFSKEYAFILITGQSRNPKEVIKRINEEIEKAISNGLNEEDFERNKKKIYGDYITEYNSVEESARMFLADYFKDINSFEYLEEYKNVDKKYAEEILKKVFVLDKEITSIVI
ncbi:MAG: insulinase family protein [Clostridia bacterium]|nr:insulinase family protein [Clostridia bacterium]